MRTVATVKIMRKLLTAKPRDSEVLTPVKGIIAILIGLLQDITAFAILGCGKEIAGRNNLLGHSQMKILKKTGRFGVSNSQGSQNIETITAQCSRETAV